MKVRRADGAEVKVYVGADGTVLASEVDEPSIARAEIDLMPHGTDDDFAVDHWGQALGKASCGLGDLCAHFYVYLRIKRNTPANRRVPDALADW